MKIIAKQQATMTNHQVMMCAPPEMRNEYFDKIYKTINLETTNQSMEEEVRQLELLARQRELEKATADKNDNHNVDQQAGVSDTNNEDRPDNNATMFGEFTDQSRWVQLVVGRKPVEAADLAASSKGSVFACVHNRDNNDFMDLDKFERFISKRMNNVNPPCWDLLDETASQVIDHIVEDEDQVSSKEWGPYGWYRHPTEEQIKKACDCKTIHLSI